jgi:hypothetical protein
MRLRIGRFKDKPGANLSTWDPSWSTGGKWHYVVWVEESDIEVYNDSLNTIIGYSPELHTAQVSPFAIEVPEAITKLVEALNSIRDQEGMVGVSCAGYALLDDLKQMVAKAFASGAGDADPQYLCWSSGGHRPVPLP